jgi:TolB-like protein
LASIRSLAVVLAGVVLAAPGLAADDVRVALLPIAVHASGGDSGYLQTGLAEMISARLEQYRGLEVVRPAVDATPAPARDEALARAREVGADLVLYGSFTRFGEGASLDLRCAEVGEGPADGEEAAAPPARRVFIQAGTLAEIIPDLDTLAEKVARFAFRTSTTPPKHGEQGTGVAAADGVSSEDVADLRTRVEAIERTLYAPVAQGEPPRSEAAETDGGAAPSVVR